MRGGDGASTDVPIAPRDASDGRVSGILAFFLAFLFLLQFFFWTVFIGLDLE